MIYVMSDLHGCFDEFQQALQLIDFQPDDVLYVLGDVIDRGSQSIELLNFMMMHDNIIPIVGNHELMAMSLLPKLCTEITESNYDSTLTENDLISLEYWMHDGGKTTLDAFQKLDRWEMEMILDYFDEFRLYEVVQTKDHSYVLIHAGVPFNLSFKQLDQLRIEDTVFTTTDYSIDGYVLICGHTPTASHRIEYHDAKISIDCGCIFGGAVGVLRLDDMKEFYIKSSSHLF